MEPIFALQPKVGSVPELLINSEKASTFYIFEEYFERFLCFRFSMIHTHDPKVYRYLIRSIYWEEDAMKFELPVIKVMVTADSPACFGEESEILYNNHHISACDCECMCLTLCPCQCPCVCLCQCECQCECMCPCQCQNEASMDPSNHNPDECSKYPCKILMPNPPIVLTHSIHGSVLHTSPARTNNESYLTKNETYILRREQFGSILFDKETFNTYLCNHTATEMLQFIEDNDDIHVNDIKRISSHIQETFEDVPIDINSVVYPFIYRCLQLRETPLVKLG